MISLYLYNECKNNLDKLLIEHLSTEYKYNLNYPEILILEKYGIYDGCENLATYLNKRVKNKLLNGNIKEKFTVYKKDLKQFKNIFFDSLTVIIKKSNEVSGGYVAKSKYDSNITINLNVDTRIKNDNYIDIFIHELIHAYNDYLLSINEVQSLFKISNTDFYKYISKHNDEESDDEYLLKHALYFLNNYERNAYIGQLKAELIKNKDIINNPIDALKAIKKSEIYQSYAIIEQIINKFENLDNDGKGRLAEISNKISNGKYTTFESLLKTLKSKYYKSINKITKTISKMSLDFLNLNESLKCITLENNREHIRKALNLIM